MPKFTPEVKDKLNKISRIDRIRYRLLLKRQHLQQEIYEIEQGINIARTRERKHGAKESTG